MNYIVKTLFGKFITLEVEPTDRIEDVKNKIQDKTGDQPCRQRLVYNGKVLNNENLVQDYSIEKG